MSIKVDEEHCVGCGCCMDGCKVGALEFHSDRAKVQVNKHDCIECQKCFDLCAVAALSL